MKATRQVKRPGLLALAIRKVHKDTFGKGLRSKAHSTDSKEEETKAPARENQEGAAMANPHIARVR